MLHRCVMIVTVLLATDGLFAEALPFREQYSLRDGDLRGRAELMMYNTTVAEDGWLVMDVRYHNLGRGCKLFNPFFNPLLPYPAKCAVFDAEKKFVKDLILRRDHVSRRWPHENDWAYLPGKGGYIGKEMMYPVQLKPGTYYVQFVYLRLFVTERRANRETDDDVWTFARTEQGELCRSNAVKIEVVDRELPLQQK